MGASSLVSDDEMLSAIGHKKVICYEADRKNFFEALNKNMTDLGLVAPSGYMKSIGMTLGVAGTMVSAVETLGPQATTRELLKATKLSERIKIGGAFLASYYVGAFIGSIFVAGNKSIPCARKFGVVGVNQFQKDTGLDFTDSKIFFSKNPEIINKNMPNRAAFGSRVKR